jgi:hypothetical protein
MILLWQKRSSISESISSSNKSNTLFGIYPSKSSISNHDNYRLVVSEAVN